MSSKEVVLNFGLTLLLRHSTTYTQHFPVNFTWFY